MTQEETQRLLDQASSSYNDGQYDDAIALWNQVLATEPDNARALEGIKMANLLLSDWVQPATPQSAPLAGTSAPSDAGFVDEQLALARHYTMLGDVAEAGAACRRVLEIDAGNVVAAELLVSMSGNGGAGTNAPLDPAPAVVPLPAPGSRATAAAPDDAELTLEPLSLEPGDEVGDLPWEATPPARREEGVEGRIASLLEEGDRFEQAGRYQDAIDTWSRIFVLQDAHPDAELRMDRARRALEQQARRMEEHLARGEEMAAEGRIPEALDSFRSVLEIRFEHAEARRRIAELEAKLAAGPAAPAPGPPEVRQPPPPPPLDLEDETMASQLPTPPPLPARGSRRAARKGTVSGSLVKIAVASLGVSAVLGVVGYFAWQTFFPGGPGDDAPPVSARAAGESRTAPPPPPPAEAAPAAPLSVQEVTPAPAPLPAAAAVSAAPAKTDVNEELRLGIESFRAGDYAEAKVHLDEVLRVDPSHFEATEWAAKTNEAIDKGQRYATEIASIQQAFAQRDYRGALYKLYRVETPEATERKKVERWIAACWYDWGVEALQAGRLEDAQKNFKEARDARADDSEAARHLQVLERYQGRSADAALQAYAARLALRPLE